MYQYFSKLLRLFKKRSGGQTEDSQSPEDPQASLSGSLTENLKEISRLLGTSSDVVIREFSFGREGRMKASLLFISGLADPKIINESIIKPLMVDSRHFEAKYDLDLSSMEKIKINVLAAGEVKLLTSIREVVDASLGGNAVLMVEGQEQALAVDAKGWEKRAVSEPATESVVRGPREGFTENLGTNMSLLRRRIMDASLRLETVEIGQRTKTRTCIAYLEGLTNPELVREVKRRLSNIKTDAILSDGYIEEYIEDAPFSVFQTIASSEKPDVIAAKLLEGRAALLVDGSPFALTMPMLFIENFQSSEDYVQRSYYATLLRLLRLLAFLISLLSPALYVAFTTFHQELLPTPLLFTMAAASEGVPFPGAVEAAVMLITFEILQEAGVRLPKPVGQAISIVGALVMGQAAVQAGIVGAPIVIVIAFTAVTSFVSPWVNEATAILRWFLLFLGTFMGGFGITLGILAILTHLVTLKSFSTSYLSPAAPLCLPDLKDTFIRKPLWSMRTRPRALKAQDLQRQSFEQPFIPRYRSDEQREEEP